MDAEILSHIGSFGNILSNNDCQQLYEKNASYLEIREFVVKYSLDGHFDSAFDEGSRNSTAAAATAAGKKPKHKVPVASLRGVINPLLEERRYEECVRFIVAVGDERIIQDRTVVDNMLAVFRPTSLIEKDLKERSSFLLKSVQHSSIDTTEVWKIDDERRRTIARSQQTILAYLSSVCDRCQFVKPWFDSRFADNPDLFEILLKELASAPEEEETEGEEKLGDSSEPETSTAALETEMYTYRVLLACVLLKQMRADLALHISNPYDSMFYKLVYGSQGVVALSSWATIIGGTVSNALNEEMSGGCSSNEKTLASLMENMLFTIASAGALDMDMAVITIFKNPDVRFNEWIELLDMAESDMVAVRMIDHILVSRFRFDLKAGKQTAHLGAKAISLPPGGAKTVFCLQCVRPKSNANNSKEWYQLVAILGRLVQRTVNAYGSRMYHINSHKQLAAEGAGGGSEAVLATRLQASGGIDVEALHKACVALVGHLEEKLPRPDAHSEQQRPKGVGLPVSAMEDGGSSSKTLGSGSLNKLEMVALVYLELDLIESFLEQLLRH
ncbi:hypothetical protein H4S06_000137 [Coemansia sp. BCRC 34490]|nr:hypothetical protein H4S06_000137 [Coemansia sp. BCRC 34490]